VSTNGYRLAGSGSGSVSRTGASRALVPSAVSLTPRPSPPASMAGIPARRAPRATRTQHRSLNRRLSRLRKRSVGLHDRCGLRRGSPRSSGWGDRAPPHVPHRGHAPRETRTRRRPPMVAGRTPGSGTRSTRRTPGRGCPRPAWHADRGAGGHASWISSGPTSPHTRPAESAKLTWRTLPTGILATRSRSRATPATFVRSTQVRRDTPGEGGPITGGARRCAPGRRPAPTR
jgi:hypothetical protein